MLRRVSRDTFDAVCRGNRTLDKVRKGGWMPTRSVVFDSAGNCIAFDDQDNGIVHYWACPDAMRQLGIEEPPIADIVDEVVAAGGAEMPELYLKEEHEPALAEPSGSRRKRFNR